MSHDTEDDVLFLPMKPKRAANLLEASLQDEHARNMRAVAHEVASRPDSMLDASDFLEMARQARCNAAILRGRG